MRGNGLVSLAHPRGREEQGSWFRASSRRQASVSLMLWAPPFSTQAETSCARDSGTVVGAGGNVAEPACSHPRSSGAGTA